MRVRTLVLRAAGTNCDLETAYAFEKAGAEAELVHINELVRKEKDLAEYQVLAIPGGFTYGDDISAGRILANELRYKLSDRLLRFVEEGKLIIGICNGFQVLVKAGFLPALKGPGKAQEATLGWNDSGRFEDRWVYLKVEPGNRCAFTDGLEGILYMPVAHAEGKFIAPQEVIKSIEENAQVVLRYVDPSGELSGYPWNPNGSLGNIAGICDPTGRIFGLMPHPERHIDGFQHPRWTREGLKEEGDGMGIFRNAVRYVRENL
ncbi:MAG: phosphoribosylformylglycinamidine synthase I [Candidatus Latescibacterota bacterium]|nr:MAG: phosphoribosylformylglycinamidine synthase I [Candidatus Latescibacterota bacterium]RKY73588.1 MAG: phosphoribosylformylglycinamidine synthase I [Candidatus Latescibacterota bacterium]HDI00739.1 phosphoribosylformylglycinamidine synthase I [Bacillota bacterium]